jgi:hypothetical protein
MEQTLLPRPMAFVVPYKFVDFVSTVHCRVLGGGFRGCWFEPPTVMFRFLKAWCVKRKITFVRFFQDASRYICVTAGAEIY